ncbi:MAG: WecB/TagA/CpsF family glycosyltransferase [Firmicutes bacterium]|nr:WecB/TagA/CpsF family glycosyltransferase [Bacillota bacterium]
MDKVNILGVNVDMVNIGEAADMILDFFDGEGLHSVFTPNSEIIMAAYRDSAFCDVLNRSDLLTADGIGVVYASKILKKPIKERAAGYDIACRVLERINGSAHKLFLFGGKPGAAEKAAENLLKTYPKLNIAGMRNGYFKKDEEEEIVAQINASDADIIFVCLGAPKQEMWIDKYREKLNAKVAMGIGGSLDVFAGTAERAPDFFCNHGLEWLYRLYKEPQRIGRMMDLPKFAVTVFFKGKKFKQSE